MSQSGEKTEKATPKKRKDAREQGQVLKSTEVNTAVSLLAMFGLLKFIAPYLATHSIELMGMFLSGKMYPGAGEFSYRALYPAISNLLFEAVLMIAPLLGCAFVIGVAINIMQVGFLFTTKTLKPKFSRINPLQGLKRMFSARSFAEFVKSILKVVIIGWIVYDEYAKNLSSLPSMMHLSVPDAIEVIVDTVLNIGLKAGMVLLILSAADFLYQWWEHEKELKMTKQEVKDEYKQIEGDPQVKNRIRQKQREMGMMRMMQSIPEADVVITNPTHYAVALLYKENEMSAPKVIAKGRDLVARRIREAARESGVEIVENKPVAQALYAYCEVGDEIPDAMYQAVAEILALVYRARNAAAGGTR